MKKHKYFLALIVLNLTFSLHSNSYAQTAADSINGPVSLKQAIDFALRNQPAVRQASIDEQINERDIKIGLSAWL
ncbi:MAG TPA: TolC family protein, partial [Mucilaginibacter sp.]